jgi:hypothetical protein
MNLKSTFRIGLIAAIIGAGFFAGTWCWRFNAASPGAAATTSSGRGVKPTTPALPKSTAAIGGAEAVIPPSHPVDAAEASRRVERAILSGAFDDDARTVRVIHLLAQSVDVDSDTWDRLIHIVGNAEEDMREFSRLFRQSGPLKGREKLMIDEWTKVREDLAAVVGRDAGNYFLGVMSAQNFVSLADEFARRCAAEGIPIAPKTIGAVQISFAFNLMDPDSLTLDGLRHEEVMAMKSVDRILTPAQMEIFQRMWAEHPRPKP